MSTDNMFVVVIQAVAMLLMVVGLMVCLVPITRWLGKVVRGVIEATWRLPVYLFVVGYVVLSYLSTGPVDPYDYPVLHYSGIVFLSFVAAGFLFMTLGVVAALIKALAWVFSRLRSVFGFP